ncbi:MAG: hypothetical protein HY422_03250 [Candidatus Komeilibacteria bacterium]|nr:hypothetical protein [Candidatus Komeilibacteria bacterium]
MAARPKIELKGLLQELGLTPVQVELYLASLRHGILSVLELSHLTKINRQQIYQGAEQLVDLGLYDITRKQRRKYIPANPDKLLKLVGERRKELEETAAKIQAAIPRLADMQLPSPKRIITKYYEGLERIGQAYNDELSASKNIEGRYFGGLLDYAYEYFSASYWKRWNKRFSEQNSYGKILVHNSDAAREFARFMLRHHMETRYLVNFPLKVNIDIFGKTVLIISYEDELAIWLESPVLAQSYRIIFDSLWPLAKPFE